MRSFEGRAMEPIRHTLTARLRFLKMYREEVDQLLALFQQSCEKVTISDSKYRYASLEEMKQKVAPRLKDFDIRGENPGVRFLFNLTRVRGSDPPTQAVFNELRTEEITDAADSLFYKVKDFLIGHQRPAFLREWIIPTTVSLISMFWFLLHVRSELGFSISFIVFMVCFLVGMSTTNCFSLETKRNSASFFVRNREEFAKYAVTAIISGVVGGIVGWLIGHFLK